MNFSKNDTLKIKGIAIILMIIHHSFLSPARYAGKEVIFTPLSEHHANVIALSMKICVALFVFLSAYGLTISFKKVNNDFIYSKKEFRNLLLSRYIKMMANFMFVFVLLQIYSFAMGLKWYPHVYGKGILSVFYMLLDLFGLAQIFHTPTFIATFWYMSLAQIIIFLFPLFLWIYKKFSGYVLLFVSLLVSILFPVYTADASKPDTYAFFTVYILCVSIGIIAAGGNLLVRMRSFNPLNKIPFLGKIIKFIFYIVVIFIFTYLRYKTRETSLLPTWEAILSLLIIAFSFEFIHVIPGISHALAFLGKYSMNIFLIHNFIRIAWYYDFTYSFRYSALIVLVLLSISLAVSIAIELLKKLVRFDSLIKFLQKKSTS